MNYLLSIAIPTRNRYETLKVLLIKMKTFVTDDIEIIIQDNSDNNIEFLQFIKNVNIKNLKYYYISDWLSVVDNCDLAVSNSQGKYITFIGDDDAVAPQILDIVKLLDDFGIESCVGCQALYRWPAVMSKRKYSYEYRYSNRIIYFPVLIKLLKKIMKGGIQSKENLPCVYHGIVKKSLLEAVQEKTGSFFPGPSPDMANAFALSIFVKSHLVTSIPFIIDGYSKASTGHLTEVKKHVGLLEEQTFLPRDTVENWTKELPPIWLPNTIWPQSAIHALKCCDKEELIEHVNFNAIYIKIKILYPDYWKLYEEIVKKNTYYYWTYIKVGSTFLKNKIFKIAQRRKVKKENMTIEDAIDLTEKIIVAGRMIERLGEKLKER